MPRSRATAGAVIVLVTAVVVPAAGCLYIPPLNHTQGAAEVADAARVAATPAAPGGPLLDRGDVERRRGPPGARRKEGVWVYSWDQSFGYWAILGYPNAAAGEFTGKRLNVVVVFDGDRVARYEWDADPPVAPGDGIDPPLPAEADGPAGTPARPVLADPGARCLAFASDLRRCLVALDADGSAYAVGGDGRRGAPARGVPPRRSDPGWSKVMLVTPDDRFVVLGEPKAISLSPAPWTRVWDLASGTTRQVPAASAADDGGGPDDTSAAFGDGRGDGDDDDGAGPGAESAALSAAIAENDRALLAAVAAGGPKGHWLAVRDGRHLVRVLDTTTWSEVARVEPSLIGPGAALGGGRLALANGKGSIEVFDLASGRREAGLHASGSGGFPGRTLAFSADGRWLAAATTAAIEVWDVDRLAEASAASPDGQVEATDGLPTDALAGVALLPAHKRRFLPPPLAIAPDGSLVAAASHARIRVVSASGEHVAWLEAPAEVQALRFRAAAPAILEAFTADPFTPVTFDLAAVASPPAAPRPAAPRPAGPPPEHPHDAPPR